MIKPLKKGIKPLKHIEKLYILKALVTCNWNRTHAANALKIHIRTLRNKIRTYKLEGIRIKQSSYRPPYKTKI